MYKFPVRSTKRHVLACAALLFGLCASVATQAAAPAVVGILQGTATLVRDTSRYALAEGVALASGDIVETAADGYVQVELEDGTIAGLAENGRLLFMPRLTLLKTAAAPNVYLLEGWLKVTATPKAPAEFALLAPGDEVVTAGATFVTRVVRGKGYELFVEGGSARLIPRSGGGSTVPLRANDFASQATGADRPTVSTSIGSEFLAQLPRIYRDRLPARAAMYADRPVTPRLLAPVSYPDVTAWMHSEPGVRLALSRQWRSRAADRAFRSEVAANMPAHGEWERVLYPERFLPKPPVKRVAAPAPKPGIAPAALTVSSAPATRLTPIPQAADSDAAPARAASATTTD